MEVQCVVHRMLGCRMFSIFLPVLFLMVFILFILTLSHGIQERVWQASLHYITLANVILNFSLKPQGRSLLIVSSTQTQQSCH